MISRRTLLQALAGGTLLDPFRAAAQPAGRINRAALARAYSPSLQAIDPFAPLSVGNGEFAFTGDITGLQTFPELYEKSIPLCTQSQWGWHTAPNPNQFTESELKLEEFDAWGRKVGYATSSRGQRELFNWLRENPHRLHLGRIGLEVTKKDGSKAAPGDLTSLMQRLDLWNGVIRSSFKIEGTLVAVELCCHPDIDMLAVRVVSPLDSGLHIGVRFAFPYGSTSMSAADWTHPERHTSKVAEKGGKRVEIERRLDGDSYSVSVAWEGEARWARDAAHQFLLQPAEGAVLQFVSRFTPQSGPDALPGVDATFTAAAKHWQQFWSTGGAVDVSDSVDSRADELERRIVLSQYLTAIQTSGSLPPQETGLTCNSWYGKFHLEMHWWHAVHFALWDRTEMLERSLPWYQAILPAAQAKAAQQGYKGARWPKMTAPDGRDSPSPIGPLLIWEQPHPIYYAHLMYLTHPERATLERYRRIVFESADFMASYAALDPKRNRYVLGPPVIPAQENHPPRETWNPTYELEYWHWALQVAQEWRQGLGMPPEPSWQRVIDKLSPLPVMDGVYLAHENCPQTFTERNHDHPSMLMALGFLPGQMADRETMLRTLHKVMEVWDWPSTWGWDYPMVAMTAARLGEASTAVDALLMETPKNKYLANGHNYQRPNLPLYLPGNGGLLSAISMMAAGWRGGPKEPAPGFPKDTWTVRWEGLNAWL